MMFFFHHLKTALLQPSISLVPKYDRVNEIRVKMWWFFFFVCLFEIKF